MSVDVFLKKLRHYINYFLPREVMGPVILVFATENVVDILFRMYMPVNSELYGWILIMIASLLLIKSWGDADEDIEELEEAIEEVENGEKD